MKAGDDATRCQGLYAREKGRRRETGPWARDALDACRTIANPDWPGRR